MGRVSYRNGKKPMARELHYPGSGTKRRRPTEAGLGNEISWPILALALDPKGAAKCN